MRLADLAVSLPGFSGASATECQKNTGLLRQPADQLVNAPQQLRLSLGHRQPSRAAELARFRPPEQSQPVKSFESQTNPGRPEAICAGRGDGADSGHTYEEIYDNTLPGPRSGDGPWPVSSAPGDPGGSLATVARAAAEWDFGRDRFACRMAERGAAARVAGQGHRFGLFDSFGGR